MRYLFTSIVCLLLFSTKAQDLSGKNTYDPIPSQDRSQFIVPKKQVDYEYDSRIHIPSSSRRRVNDTDYCKAIPVDAFDPANLTQGKGIALFRNKHDDPMYVKNAQWFLSGSDNIYDQLFEEGNAELLLTREGKWYYHYGWSVHEGLGFGWNIYTRADGKFEFGMVGGSLALYPLEVMDYSLNFDAYKSIEISHNGVKRKYFGQISDDKPNGFGLVLNELQHVVDYGFWENGNLQDVADVLTNLYRKHGLKTEEWRGRKISYGGFFDKKRRKITGFFEKSRKTRTPYGWFVSTYSDDEKIAGYAGYFPKNQTSPDKGYLESPDESYGVMLCKRKTYSGYWVKKPTYYRTPFKSLEYKYYDSDYLSYISSGIPFQSAATIPALTFNYTSIEVIRAEEKAKKLAEEKRLAEMRQIYNAAIAKPGYLVQGTSGTVYYVNRINQNTHCLELYPFPFTSSNYDLAQRSQDGSHIYEGKTYCRYSMSNNDDAMVPYCLNYGLTTINNRICPRCSGMGEVLKETMALTGGGRREHNYYYTVGDITYKKSYYATEYGQKKVWIGVTCPKCYGKGYH